MTDLIALPVIVPLIAAGLSMVLMGRLRAQRILALRADPNGDANPYADAYRHTYPCAVGHAHDYARHYDHCGASSDGDACADSDACADGGTADAVNLAGGLKPLYELDLVSSQPLSNLRPLL